MTIDCTLSIVFDSKCGYYYIRLTPDPNLDPNLDIVFDTPQGYFTLERAKEAKEKILNQLGYVSLSK